jgi:SAM-dependent methyltransferase/transcription elongation factor Elf1
MTAVYEGISKNRESFNPMIWIFQLVRSLFWRSLRKGGLVSAHETLEDQRRDSIAPFDEYTPCEMCGGESVSEKIIAKDGSRIVECNKCGLWFTSPRIKETEWIDWLNAINERSIEFTENRLRYGVALPSNVKYSSPFWRESKRKIYNMLIDEIEKYFGEKIQSIHDVGCGVGSLLDVARARGIEVTGNDLNGYACKVMRERFGFTVYNDSLPNLDMKNSSVDAIVLRDYIEHTYHPLADLKASYKFLRTKGILYIETFKVDCAEFKRLGGDWNMLFWNHVFHFCTKTLTDMVQKAGFNIVYVKSRYEDSIIKIFARKE